jgi:hypothetical protein
MFAVPERLSLPVSESLSLSQSLALPDSEAWWARQPGLVLLEIHAHIGLSC